MHEHDLRVRATFDIEVLERVPEAVATGAVANGQRDDVLVTVEADTREGAIAVLEAAGFELV